MIQRGYLLTMLVLSGIQQLHVGIELFAVESNGNVRPHRGKRDSVKATESNGTHASKTETDYDSFGSDSDELGID